MQQSSNDRSNQNYFAVYGLCSHVEDHCYDEHDKYLEVVVATEPREELLKASEPVDFFITVHKVTDPQHEEEGTTECVDDRRCFMESCAVLERFVERKIDNSSESISAREHDKENGENKSNNKYCKYDADGQEEGLPELGHAA